MLKFKNLKTLYFKNTIEHSPTIRNAGQVFGWLWETQIPIPPTTNYKIVHYQGDFIVQHITGPTNPIWLLKVTLCLFHNSPPNLFIDQNGYILYIYTYINTNMWIYICIMHVINCLLDFSLITWTKIMTKVFYFFISSQI